MILSGEYIRQSVKGGKIYISDFNENHINPNSYDLRLGNTLMVYKDEVLDTRANNRTEIIRIPNEGYTLKRREFYLGHSVEAVGSDHFVPVLHCKSGIARLGLFIHVTADLIDIGSKGNITFQLHPTVDIKVYPGMRIAQMSFWSVQGDIKTYTGKYQNSVGPVASRSYIDMEKAS